jgi:hypothetical protein
MFRRNMSPSHSGSRNKPNKLATCFTWYVPPKCWLTFNGVISQNIECFMITTGRTSHLHAFYGIWRFITVFTRTLHWSGSWEWGITIWGHITLVMFRFVSVLFNINARRWLLFGFGVPIAVVMKRSVFWDVIPCSQLTLNGLYGVVSQKIEELLIIIVSIKVNISILNINQHQNIKYVLWYYFLIKTCFKNHISSIVVSNSHTFINTFFFPGKV